MRSLVLMVSFRFCTTKNYRVAKERTTDMNMSAHVDFQPTTPGAAWVSECAELAQTQRKTWVFTSEPLNGEDVMELSALMLIKDGSTYTLEALIPFHDSVLDQQVVEDLRFLPFACFGDLWYTLHQREKVYPDFLGPLCAQLTEWAVFSVDVEVEDRVETDFTVYELRPELADRWWAMEVFGPYQLIKLRNSFFLIMHGEFERFTNFHDLYMALEAMANDGPDDKALQRLLHVVDTTWAVPVHFNPYVSDADDDDSDNSPDDQPLQQPQWSCMRDGVFVSTDRSVVDDDAADGDSEE
jgi:hypothetical protein